ncbi:kallikrein-4-like [Vanessa cardui]|uniref:kallikrein-4-like n=1 Tax=Vanessa cardui TaxID=171605 RepID=UPI001F134F68|nr:kallikrein-4-like [Vanessa cardui]
MLLQSIIVILRFLVVTSSRIESKIVSGEKTKIKYHPYSAALLISQGASSHICGASIVNQKVLLTAAHCFEDTQTLKTKGSAHIGHSNMYKGRVIKLSTLMVHPKYDTVEITCDIALVGLKREIQFGRSINRVALARRRPRKGPAMIAGWGLLEEEPRKDTDVLYETRQRVWPKRDCVKLLVDIPKGTFCGGQGPDGGYPSNGDSGSPLIIDGYMQIGLVSFKKMDISTSVIVYTDTTHFYKWIAKNAKAVFLINRVALAQRRPRAGLALIAGWGLLSEEPYKDTDLLHETEQEIWPNHQCVKLLRKLPEGTFCGGEGRHGGYPSMGDSGSPLIVNGYLQIGLVSFKKIHVSRSVIVYTDVAYYYKWIVENARNVFCG